MQAPPLGLTAGSLRAVRKHKMLGLWGLGSQGGVRVRQEQPRHLLPGSGTAGPLAGSASECCLIPFRSAGQGRAFPLSQMCGPRLTGKWPVLSHPGALRPSQARTSKSSAHSPVSPAPGTSPS